MPTVQIGPWARNMALFAYFLLFCFSLPCFVYINGTGNGVYGIILSAILFPFLYPVWHLRNLLWFTQIYWFMALLTAGSSIYCYFITPQILPAILLDFSAILYIVAFLRKEKTLTIAQLQAADNRLWMSM